MEYNMVTYMFKGKLKTQFVSLNPKILAWLESNNYKHFKFGSYDKIDAIFARTKVEANIIYRHEIENP